MHVNVCMSHIPMILCKLCFTAHTIIEHGYNDAYLEYEYNYAYLEYEYNFCSHSYDLVTGSICLQ